MTSASDRPASGRPAAGTTSGTPPAASPDPLHEARNGTTGRKSGLNIAQSRAIGQDPPSEGSRQGREYLREATGGPAAESAADHTADQGLPPEGDFLDGNSERHSGTKDRPDGRRGPRDA